LLGFLSLSIRINYASASFTLTEPSYLRRRESQASTIADLAFTDTCYQSIHTRSIPTALQYTIAEWKAKRLELLAGILDFIF